MRATSGFGILTGVILVAVLGSYWITVDNKVTATPPTPLVDQSALIRAHSPILGSSTGKVTIVEFLDPASEASPAYHQAIESLLRSYPTQVRVIYRYAFFHDASAAAVGILEAARKQKLFEPVLQALFASRTRWSSDAASNIDVAWSVAEDVGLNLQLARRFATSAEVRKVIEIDARDGRTLGVSFSPTFFVNGKSLDFFGSQSLIDLVTSEVLSTTSAVTPQKRPDQ